MSDNGEAVRKKEMNELFGALTVPFMLNIVGENFYKFAALVFSAGESGARSMPAAFGLSFSLMVFLVYAWGRPAMRYVQTADEGLKAVIRRRLRNIYRDGFAMLLGVQALTLLVTTALPGRLTGAELGAALVAAAAQCAMLVVYIDSLLSRQKVLIESLYSKEELSRPRPGFFIPVYIKLSVLIGGFALLPFALIYLASFRGLPLEQLRGPLTMLLFVCTVLLGTGLFSVYHGIQLPLEALVAKMYQVARGEFPKTRIYFSDEIAALKAGYNDMVEGLREREALQDTFGKYLSIEIARQLLKNKKVNLGGESVEAAVMFCDIRNFTPLSEKLSAQQLVEFLNNYFHYITPPITAHNGVINKFIGDAVMAIYAPLLGSADYAADALRSAAEMRAALAAFNASGKAPGPVEFGVGLHCGRLVAGNIGTAARLEYTFIGDTVNIASRLEGKTKDLGSDVVLSGQVAARLGPGYAGFRLEALGKVPLKGKAEPLEVFRLL
jgi:class 3 adenylate cyclase